MQKREFRAKLERAVKKPNTIHGIFNYCDRWCERCNKTEFCTLYQTSTIKPDEGFENFFKELSAIFEATIDMLKEQADKTGIDFDNMQDIDIEDEFAYEKYLVRNGSGVKLAKDYSQKVAAWFEEKEKDEAEMEYRMMDKTLCEYFELIRWYQYQFEVKTVRALMSKNTEEKYNENPYDSLGTAKLLLVSIQRNIGAWGYIYNIFETDEDEILDILITLQRLERYVRQTFPQAEAFVREGLD